MKIQEKVKLGAAVKLGVSRQVVIPKKIHDQLGLAAGDYLEVESFDGKVIFTPKTLIDKHINASLEDIKRGQVYGPFSSTKDMVRSLHTGKKAKKA